MGNSYCEREDKSLQQKLEMVEEDFVDEYCDGFAEFYRDYAAVGRLYYGNRNQRKIRKIERDIRRGCVTLTGQFAQLGIKDGVGVLMALRNLGAYFGKVHPMEMLDYSPVSDCLRIKSHIKYQQFIPEGCRPFKLRQKKGVPINNKDFLYVLLPGLIVYLRCVVGDSSWKVAEKLLQPRFERHGLGIVLVAEDLKEWWDNNVAKMPLSKFEKLGGVLSGAMWAFLRKYPGSYLTPAILREGGGRKSVCGRAQIRQKRVWRELSASEKSLAYLRVLRREFSNLERFGHTADLTALRLSLGLGLELE